MGYTLRSGFHPLRGTSAPERSEESPLCCPAEGDPERGVSTWRRRACSDLPMERKGVTMDLEVLRQLKKQRKMTNKQLSQASGVPLGTVNKLMSGVTDNPKLPTVQAIARALGTTVDGIAGDAGAVDGAAVPCQGSILSPREERLLTLVRSLDERGVDTVFSVARAQLELLKSEKDSAGSSDAALPEQPAETAASPAPVPARQTVEAADDSPEKSDEALEGQPFPQEAHERQQGQKTGEGSGGSGGAEPSPAGSMTSQASQASKAGKARKEGKEGKESKEKEGKKGKKGKKHKS